MKTVNKILSVYEELYETVYVLLEMIDDDQNKSYCISDGDVALGDRFNVDSKSDLGDIYNIWTAKGYGTWEEFHNIDWIIKEN